MGVAHDWVAANMPELPRVLKVFSYGSRSGHDNYVVQQPRKNLIMLFLDWKNSEKPRLQELRLAVVPKKVSQVKNLILVNNKTLFQFTLFFGQLVKR